MGTHPIFESDFDCLTDMILRLLRRVQPVGLLINYPRRCMALTAIKRKDFEPKETFYTLLGVAENAEPMEIEDAFVKVLTDDELVIDATKVSTEDAEAKLESSLRIIEAYNTLSHPSKRIEYDVRLRMIRRGDDPDRPREHHIKDGAFIKVEKEEKTKKNANQVMDELIGDRNTANFMKTDFTHNVKVNMKSAKQRAQLFDMSMGEIKERETKARQEYNELKNASSLGMAVMFVVACGVYAAAKWKQSADPYSKPADY